MRFLRQSTASQVRTIGPFLDDVDFKTAETGLTIANTDIRIKKNGADDVAKNSGGGTHDVNGCYHLTFDATDTNTVGELFYTVKVAGALQVFGAFTVLEEAVYDALFAASAPGYGTAQTGDSFARIGAAGAGLTALGDTRIANLDAAVTTRMATYTQPTGFLAATFPSGTVASTTNITAGTITTATNLTNLPSIPANWLTAAGTAADFGTEVGTAVWATTTRVLTAGTNIQLPANGLANVTAWTVDITGSLSGSVGSVTGAVGSVTAAITLPTIPTNWLTADGLAADAVTEIQAGLATSAALATVDGIVDAILVDTAEIGAAGAGLTALASQTSVDDLPTNAELATALSTLNDLDSTEVQAAAAAALVAIHLDHWVAVADPGGVVANNSFLAKLVSKSATADFTSFNNTTDSMEARADSDFSSLLYNRIWKMVAFAGTIGATGNDTTHIHIPSLTYPDDEINGQLLVLQDNSAAGITYSRVVLDWDQASALATVALLPITPQASTDTAYLFSIRPGEGGGLDAAGVRAAIGMASADMDDQLDAINVLAGLNVYATGTADAGSSQVLLVDAERTEANGGYFTNSRVVMTSGANAGQSRPILSFSAATDTIILSESFQNAIAAGDTYAIVNDNAADVTMWGHNLVLSAINGMLPSISVAVNASGFSYTGTADGGSTTTLDDAARIGDGDDFWNGNKIRFTNGNLAGIERLIVDYNSTSGTFTLAPPLPNAVTTQAYAIVSASMQDANVTHWLGDEPEALLTGLEGRLPSAPAKVTLDAMMERVITVDDSTFSPTTTVFETDQTVDSSATYNEKCLMSRDGTNGKGIAVKIVGYAHTNGKVKLTVETLPAIPANGNTFALIGTF